MLLSLILILMLGSRNREMALVLSMLVCSVTALLALEYIQPVIDFAMQLEDLGGLDSGMVKKLLKVTGIGLLTEIAALVCSDSGSSSLGKVIKLLGNAVILWLSLPMFTMLIQLLQEIMGGL